MHTGRELDFGDGTLELDGTATALQRTGSTRTNIHKGRFLAVVHRETGQYALEVLDDKEVLKGAPPPPENYSEVKAVADMKIHGGHVVATDSAQAFKRVFKDRKDVQHVTVLHKKKDFSHVVRIPLSQLSQRVRDRVVSLPTTTRKYRIKAGDQMAENVFSVVKRNITRMNMKGRTANASLNFLSASWLVRHPGLDGVALAIRLYQKQIRDTINPKDAFKTTEWLRSLEPLSEGAYN